MDLLQQYALKLNAREPINGSWLCAIAVSRKVKIEESTDLLLDIAKSYGVQSSSGNLWQDIAIKQGAREPINGSWLQALIDIK